MHTSTRCGKRIGSPADTFGRCGSTWATDLSGAKQNRDHRVANTKGVPHLRARMNLTIHGGEVIEVARGTDWAFVSTKTGFRHSKHAFSDHSAVSHSVNGMR